MAPIKIYAPDERRNLRQRFSGGTLGNLYHSVVKGAKTFLNSSTGQKLKSSIKRKVLDAGSSVLNDALAGVSPLKALKKGARKLKKKTSKSALKAFKSSVLGKGKGKQLGGLMLYRLNKAKKARKAGSKLSGQKKKRKKKKVKKKPKKKAKKKVKKKRKSKKKVSRKKAKGKQGRKRKKGSKKKTTKPKKRKKAGAGTTVFDF